MVLLGVLIAFLWAVAAEFEVLVLKTLTAPVLLFFISVITSTMMALYLLITQDSNLKLNMESFGYVVLISMCGFIGAYVLLFHLLQRENVSVVLGITNTTALFSLLFGAIFHKTHTIGVLKQVGIILSVCSAIMLTL